jgi:hypothetical protein
MTVGGVGAAIRCSGLGRRHRGLTGRYDGPQRRRAEAVPLNRAASYRAFAGSVGSGTIVGKPLT